MLFSDSSPAEDLPSECNESVTAAYAGSFWRRHPSANCCVSESGLPAYNKCSITGVKYVPAGSPRYRHDFWTQEGKAVKGTVE